jgi:hypothetical protein
MRKIVLGILGLVLGFAAMKAGWLWLAVFVSGAIFLYGLTLPKISTITRSFTTFLALFVWVGMCIAWGVWGLLQMIEAGEIPGITTGRWFELLVRGQDIT